MAATAVPVLVCPGRDDGLGPLGRCRRSAQATQPRNANWLAHYADHRLGPLWRFHALHHSQEELSVLTSFRAHPLMHTTGFLLATIPVVALMPARPVAPVLITIYVCIGTLQHANLRWTFGPAGRVLVSPAYHRLHHAPDTQRVNLGVVLTIWDILAGCARFPSRTDAPGRTGLDGRPVPVEQDGPAGPVLPLLGEQLIEPFRLGPGDREGRLSGWSRAARPHRPAAQGISVLRWARPVRVIRAAAAALRSGVFAETVTRRQPQPRAGQVVRADRAAPYAMPRQQLTLPAQRDLRPFPGRHGIRNPVRGGLPGHCALFLTPLWSSASTSARRYRGLPASLRTSGSRPRRAQLATAAEVTPNMDATCRRVIRSSPMRLPAVAVAAGSRATDVAGAQPGRTGGGAVTFIGLPG